MEKKEWSKFLKTRRVNARKWYKARRTCVSCQCPIVDINRSGYCKVCFSKVRYGVRDITRHDKLKEKAAAFLMDIGCANIKQEYRLVIGKKPVLRVDVIGYRQGKSIVVECGGSFPMKLQTLRGFVDIIYIWPYGAKEPYRWEKDIVICHQCGHIN